MLRVVAFIPPSLALEQNGMAVGAEEGCLLYGGWGNRRGCRKGSGKTRPSDVLPVMRPHLLPFPLLCNDITGLHPWMDFISALES